MKKWVWILIIGGGGFLVSQFVERDAVDYGDYARDVMFVQTPDAQYVGGEIITSKPLGSSWSDKEKGVTTANDAGLRYAVQSLDLTEAESNTLTANAHNFKVDAIATPQAILER